MDVDRKGTHFAKTGEMTLHGPHHVAQKSIATRASSCARTLAYASLLSSTVTVIFGSEWTSSRVIWDVIYDCFFDLYLYEKR